MNLVQEAVIYATEKHAGQTRKIFHTPYISHPLEVAQIVSTLTDDKEAIAAGVLHDIAEDTDGTLEDIRQRFGARVARLVEAETEEKHRSIRPEESWKQRKDDTIARLKATKDIDVKRLALADKLSNMRSLSKAFAEMGASVFDEFHQKDSKLHRWYFTAVAEAVANELGETPAYEEFVRLIGNVWPAGNEL